MRADLLRAGVAIALVAALLLVGSPPAHGSPATRAHASGPPQVPALPSGGAAGSAAAPAAGLDCAALALRAAALRGGIDAPPAVAGRLVAPCPIAPDEASLSFLSATSGSGERVTVPITLPGAGTAFAQAYASFSFRLWARGIPCSFEGLTDVQVRFVPPSSPFAAAPSPNWTVWAPAWDLVPPAACDPTCQNDSATVTVLGARFCEENVVTSGIGGPAGPVRSDWPSGDALNLTFVGSASGPGPLQVWLNDSTHPTLSTSWTYDAATIRGGRSLAPAFAEASANATGWGDHGAFALAWEGCPPTYGASGPAPCGSYNGPLLAAVAGPSVGAPHYFPAAGAGYTGAYDGVGTASSSGACRTGPGACADFASYGGTGAYPGFRLDAAGGAASFGFGNRTGAAGSALAGAGVEFPDGNGTLRVVDPTSLGPLGIAVGASAANLTVEVADPSGILAVEAQGLYCYGSSSPTVRSASATLAPGPGNSSRDGLWRASLPLAGYTGTFPAWVRAESASGRWSPAVAANFSASGGAGSCPLAAPAPPTFGPSNVTPAALGYLVTWNSTAPAVTGFTLTATPAGGGTPVAVAVGNVSSTTIAGLAPNVSYDLAVTAVNAAGLRSGAAAASAGPTLEAFAVRFTTGTSAPVWVTSPPVNVTANATGGAPPYTFRFDFGDGTTFLSNASSGNVSALHRYGGYFGDAGVSVTAVDALGESVAAGPVLLPVWATPLGVPQVAAAGDGRVNVSWSPPASPAGPVLRYSVYASETPAARLALAADGPTNSSARGVTVWNTTDLSLLLPVPNGVGVSLLVIAWDAFGAGQLPTGGTPLYAVPAPLVLGAIASVAGGPAPFNDSFSTILTSGTNDTLLTATYSFPGFVFVPATVTTVNGTSYLNTSHTFPGPGTFGVVLHVFDAFFDTAIGFTTVYVSPGAPPTVSVVVLNAPSYAGAPVEFEASASGGSGQYAYLWSFGDGGQASGAFVAHTFATSGAFTATVTAIDNVTEGVNVSQLAVEVFSAPTVFVATFPGANGSLSFLFEATASGGSGPSTFVWSFGDGSVATGATVAHDYAAAGRYTVNVTATDPAGRSGTTGFTVAAAPAGGGTGGSGGGLSSVALAAIAALGVVAALLLVAVVYFAGRARRPPEPEIEDGEVTLT